MPNRLDPAAWAAELSQIGLTWPAEAGSVFYRYVALLALKGVVYRSPVGDPDLWRRPAPPGYVGGQFRGNWDVAVGLPIVSASPKHIDPSGTATVAAGSSRIATGTEGPPFHQIWVLNNLPYAVRLEEGWSTQAPGPGGIVEVTATEISAATVPNATFRVMKNTT